MTAIWEVWHRDGLPRAMDDVARMGRALAGCGPDRTGAWNNGEIGVGSALARSLPELDFDRQPVVGRGPATVLVADLRLDNRAELCAELGIGGPDAALLADVDVLAAAWRGWPAGFVKASGCDGGRKRAPCTVGRCANCGGAFWRSASAHSCPGRCGGGCIARLERPSRTSAGTRW